MSEQGITEHQRQAWMINMKVEIYSPPYGTLSVQEGLGVFLKN